MNVAIFGASGATGRLLTELALEEGHVVSALVRTPAAFPYVDRVRVVQGSAFDPRAIAVTLQSADAVLSALGARSLGKEEVLERAVPLIVDAMDTAGVRRIVALGSAGALDDSLSRQPAYRRWIVEKLVYTTMLKWPVTSQRAQWATLSSSDLDWTMVMPPMLTSGKPRDRFRIDGEALPRNGSSIARADVAAFMLAQLRAPEWVRKGVYLSY